MLEQVTVLVADSLQDGDFCLGNFIEMISFVSLHQSTRTIAFVLFPARLGFLGRGFVRHGACNGMSCEVRLNCCAVACSLMYRI